MYDYTVHFITSRCLETLFLSEDHTRVNIAAGMLTTPESWRQQPAKQVCFTTDSGANIINAVSRPMLLRLLQLVFGNIVVICDIFYNIEYRAA